MADQSADVVDAVAGAGAKSESDTARRAGRGRRRGAHRIIVGRSSEMPQPWTWTSLGKPMGSSISSRNMPLLPTSTHFFSWGWKAKISREGCMHAEMREKKGFELGRSDQRRRIKRTSVYGLYAGLKRRFSMPIFLKNTRMKPTSARQHTRWVSASYTHQ